MTHRLVIVTEIISPYRIPLFNELARWPGVDLHVIFLAETDPALRQWRVYKDEIGFSYRVLTSWRRRVGRYNMLLNFGLGRALNEAAPSVILCGGYNYLASWHALLWAKMHRVPLLLWSESNLHEFRRGYALVELLKDEFMRQCSGFVVPGQTAREYLHSHKIADVRIFTAPNAVDNELFRAAAEQARLTDSARRAELNLPDRYFLFVGRLVPEKGVFDLLSAYAKLDERIRRQVGLVYVGEGPSRLSLEQRAATISPGMVRFAGFVHREQLAPYYALAEMLILPTYSEAWGLVVNEAMACALPVAVSSITGCAADLVREGWNGMLTRAGDVSSLAMALQSVSSDPDRRRRMGANSLQLVSCFSPAAWASGVAQAIGLLRTEPLEVSH